MKRATLELLSVCVITLLTGCRSQPTAPAAEMAANGCWVQIFERERMNPAGAWDVVNGPAEHSTLYGLPGARYSRWDDRIDSLIVGPHARVTLWADDYFGSEQLQFGPGARIQALGEYGFEHEPESMKIEYVP